MAALGGTPYRLGEWSCDLEGDPFLPIGALKELRRRGLAELDAHRLRRWRRNLDPAALEASRAALPGAAAGRAPARVPPLPVILSFAALTGLVYGPIGPIYNSVMQTRTPPQMRGRVVGVMTSMAYAAGPLGFMLAGPLVDAFGLKVTFLVLAASRLLLAQLAKGEGKKT